jgi:hypothetical protein
MSSTIALWTLFGPYAPLLQESDVDFAILDNPDGSALGAGLSRKKVFRDSLPRMLYSRTSCRTPSKPEHTAASAVLRPAPAPSLRAVIAGNTPLQFAPRKAGNSVFIDSDFNPHPDQWQFLSTIRRMPVEAAEEIVAEAQSKGAARAISQPSLQVLPSSSSFCRAEWGKSSVSKQRQPWRHYQTTNHE